MEISSSGLLFPYADDPETPPTRGECEIDNGCHREVDKNWHSSCVSSLTVSNGDVNALKRILVFICTGLQSPSPFSHAETSPSTTTRRIISSCVPWHCPPARPRHPRHQTTESTGRENNFYSLNLNHSSIPLTSKRTTTAEEDGDDKSRAQKMSGHGLNKFPTPPLLCC